MIHPRVVRHENSVRRGSHRHHVLQLAGSLAFGSAISPDQGSVIEREGHHGERLTGVNDVDQPLLMVDRRKLPKPEVPLANDLATG